MAPGKTYLSKKLLSLIFIRIMELIHLSIVFVAMKLGNQVKANYNTADLEQYRFELLKYTYTQIFFSIAIIST